MVKRQKVTDGFIEYHYAVISARKAAKVTFACQAQNNFGQIESKFIINLSMSLVRAIQEGFAKFWLFGRNRVLFMFKRISA